MKFHSPTPEQVLYARQAARSALNLDSDLTQSQAADIVDVELRTWQYWEAGSRAMPPGLYRLFCILTSQGDPKPKQQ